jgi:hypothetical protein
MSAPANNAFYIIVNKKDGKFEIDESNDINNILTDSPNAIIGDSSKTGKFKVKVDIADSPTNGHFNAGSKYYKLELENKDFTGLELVNNSEKFKSAAATPAVAPAVDHDVAKAANSENKKEETHTEKKTHTGEETHTGGQKQKQQKSKRNYSKKRRSSKSKSDTLRNYFNYDHLQ